MIDSTHLKFIETDTTSGLALSGDAFTQQTSFTAGQLVFTLAGLDSAKNPFAAGGYVTTSRGGTLSNGVEDFNDVGNAGTQTNVAGSCTTFAAGRCQLAVTGFSNGIAQLLFQIAAYPSSGGVLLLEDDSLGLAQGAAFAQSATTSFAAPAGYGLNLSGANANPIFGGAAAEVDDIAQFKTSTATTNNMLGVLNENDLTIPCSPPTSGCYTLSGTYTPDSTPDGRGSIVATTPGSLTAEYNPGVLRGRRFNRALCRGRQRPARSGDVPGAECIRVRRSGAVAHGNRAPTSPAARGLAEQVNSNRSRKTTNE